MIRFLPNLQKLTAQGELTAHRGLLVATLLAGWMFSSLVYAAEAEQSATSSETESQASAKPEPAENDKATSTSEVFVPTEDISEDFAVSFPVDI